MSFAPYQPAPDDPAAQTPNKGKAKSKPHRPWFPTQGSSYNTSSYQSGAIPTFGAAVSGQGPIGPVNGAVAGSSGEGPGNQWETRFSWRVDAVAAWTYLLGPISAYQSALAISPLFLIHLILGLSRAPLWLRWIWFIGEYAFIFYMAWRAYHDASVSGLARYRLPWVGDLADAWVGEE